MKMPWTDKTGLAKAAVFFATVLGVSLGLCGVNFLTVVGGAARSGSAGLISFLLVAAYVELAAMAFGALGLVIVLVVWAWQGIFGREDG